MDKENLAREIARARGIERGSITTAAGEEVRGVKYSPAKTAKSAWLNAGSSQGEQVCLDLERPEVLLRSDHRLNRCH